MLLYCAENRTAPFIDVFRYSAEAQGFQVMLTNPDRIRSAACEAFEKAYRHLSINPPSFELSCFKRYFAAQVDLPLHDSFVMADSDLYVQSPWSQFPEAVRDVAAHMVGSVGHGPDGPEDDISPHFSVWTRARLDDFIEFLLFQYRERFDELAAIHARRLIDNPRAAISDMTLLGLWRKYRQLPLYDSNQVQSDATYLDHNVSASWAANGRFTERWGRKELLLRSGRWLYRAVDGDPVQPLVIHLQGRYKLAAESIAARRRTGLLAVSAYIHLGRAVRRLTQRTYARF